MDQDLLLPKKRQQDFTSSVGNPFNYIIQRPFADQPLFAEVSQMYVSNDELPIVHRLCLRSKTCSLNCLSHTGMLCREYIVLSLYLKRDFKRIFEDIPEKFHIKNGLATLSEMIQDPQRSFSVDHRKFLPIKY